MGIVAAINAGLSLPGGGVTFKQSERTDLARLVIAFPLIQPSTAAGVVQAIDPDFAIDTSKLQ